MAIGRYDAKEVAVVVGGVYLTGFADGTFVEAEKDEDNMDTTVGAQGDVVDSTINNPLGTLTVTLQQTSPSNKYLTDLSNSGELVDAYIISNNVPKEVIGGSQCRVVKPSAVSFSDTAESREYEIRVYDYTQTSE